MQVNDLEEQQDKTNQAGIAAGLEVLTDKEEAQAARLAQLEQIKDNIKARVQERVRRTKKIKAALEATPEEIMGASPDQVSLLLDLPKGAVASVLTTVESLKDLAFNVVEGVTQRSLDVERDRYSVKDFIPKTSTDRPPDPEKLKAIGTQGADVSKGVASGALKAVESAKNLGFDVADVVLGPGADEILDNLRERLSVEGLISEPKTAAGKVAEAITQFATAFLPISQASRATGVAKAAAKVPKGIKVAAQEAAATFIGFEERMALTENLVKAVDPELAKKLPAYLKEDAEGSPFETRLVNAFEAFGFGLPVNFVLKGLRSVRDMARVNQARKSVDTVVTPVQKTMKRVRQKVENAQKQAPLPSVGGRLKEAITEPAKEKKTRQELIEASKILGITVDDLRSRDAYKAVKQLKVDEHSAAVMVVQDVQHEALAQPFATLSALVDAGDIKAARAVRELADDYSQIGLASQDTAGEFARAMQIRTNKPSVRFFNSLQESVATGKLELDDEITLAKSIIKLYELDGDVAGYMKGTRKDIRKKVKNINDVIARRFKSFLLSSPVSMARDVTSDMYRHTWEVADRFAGATVSSARRGAKAAKTIKQEKGWAGFVDEAYRNGVFRQATEATDITFTEAKALSAGYAEYWKQVIVGTGKIAKLNAKKAKEAAAETGKISAIKTGVRGFLDDMAEKAKSVRLDSSTKLNVQETDVKIADLAGRPDNVALRALDYATSAMEPVLGFYRNKDHVGQAIVFRAELKARAISRATNEGLTGEAFNARVKELTTDIWEQENLKDFLDTKKLSSLKNKTLAQQVTAGRQARAEAKRVSLTEDLTGVGKAAESLVRNIPGGDLLFPFVKTTYHLTKYELAKSPLSLLNVRGTSLTQQALRSGAGRERDLAIGRMSIATGAQVLAFKVAYDGLTRGSVIKDPGQRATLDNAGMFENSMRIGNTVIGLNDFSPLSAPFIRAANAVELFHYMDGDTIEDDIAEDITNYIAAGMLGTADQIMSSNFTGQLGDLFNVLTEQDEYGLKRTGKSLVTGLTVPGAVAWTSRFFEDNKKQTDTLWESILARLNLGEDKLDKFGRPIPRRSTAVGNIIPISITQYGANDKLAIEELNNGTIIRKPSRRVPTPVGQARLNADEYNRLLELMGELGTYDKMLKLTESPFYQSLPAIPAKEMEKIGKPTATRGGALRKLYQTDVKLAQDQLLLEYPEITARAVSDKKEYFVEGKEAPVTRFAPNEK